MSNGKPHEPDSSSPFARHDGAREPGARVSDGPEEAFGTGTQDRPELTPEDCLAAFGSESGVDLFAHETARPAADPISAAPPTGGRDEAPVSPAGTPPARTAWLGAARIPADWIRSSSISAAPVWLALAAVGGVIAGMAYAHYSRPAPAVAAIPSVSEAPRPAGSTGTTPPQPAPPQPAPPAPTSAAPKPVAEARPPVRPPAVEPSTRPLPAVTPAPRVETRGIGSEALAPSALSGLPNVPTSAPLTAPPREESESAREQRAIRSILDAYRLAYERLDPAAVAALWPGVDTRALTQAFSALSSQRLSFARCDITITGAVAVARCDGALTSTRAGETDPQSRSMAWAFALERASGQWRISGVNAR
jgi:hypothetical protein